MSSCPWCYASIELGMRSLPILDRDDTPVVFRQCPRCECLLPMYPRTVSSASEETNLQVDYHEELWRSMDHVEFDLDLVRGRVLSREICAQLADPKTTTLAEIGFGRGNLLFALRRHGVNAIGCEPSKELFGVARRAYALPAESISCVDAEGYLEQLTQTDQHVDGLIFWHILEHLQDPLYTLTRYHHRFPGALVFAEFPIAIKDDIFPEHLSFPAPKTLLHVSEELGLGLKEIGVVGEARLRVTFGGSPSPGLPDGYVDAVSDYVDLSPVFRSYYQGAISA